MIYRVIWIKFNEMSELLSTKLVKLFLFQISTLVLEGGNFSIRKIRHLDRTLAELLPRSPSVLLMDVKFYGKLRVHIALDCK